MSRVYDRPIIIQKINSDTEKWEDLYKLHARINKASNDNEYLSAGAIQSKKSLTFEVRYFKGLEDISLNTQHYRVVYENHNYNIKDYDDYMLKHMTIKLLGVSY